MFRLLWSGMPKSEGGAHTKSLQLAALAGEIGWMLSLMLVGSWVWNQDAALNDDDVA